MLLEGVEVSPHAKEDLLEDIISVVGVSGEPLCEAVDVGFVSFKEEAEGFLIALEASLEEGVFFFCWREEWRGGRGRSFWHPMRFLWLCEPHGPCLTESASAIVAGLFGSLERSSL